MRAAAMSLTATTSGFLVLLLTVTVMHSLGDWGVTYTSPHICAVKGSTVEIRCTYTYPLRKHDRETTVEKTLWFSKQSNDIYVDLRTDPDYSGRVDYRCGNNDCTLRITDLRKSDSAVYMFRFITNHQGGAYTGSPGVTLFVADLQVSRSPIRDSQSVELKCQSSCPLPDHQPYVWYSNGLIIEGQTSQSYLSHFDSRNKISCAVSGHENATSPSVLVKAAWDVTYTSTQICAFEGSTVEMHCSYTYPPRIRVAETFWFTKMKDNQFVELEDDQDYHGRVEYSKKSCSLTIKNLKKTDSAEYKFRFITNQEHGKYTGEPGVTLSVSDPQLQIRVRRSTVNQFSTWTELTCHSNCQHADYPSYVWYKNGIRVEEKKRYLHLQTFGPSDTYYCAVKEQEHFRSPAVYAPKPPSVSVSPSAEIVEGRSVTLICSSDANPAANYTWYKENGNPAFEPLSKESHLNLRSIQSSESGEFYCTAESELGRTSKSITINVKYPPKPPSVSVSPSAEIVEGRSVTLTCSSDANPAATYTWYKDNQTLLRRPGGQYHFPSISSKDRGSYYCKAQNRHGHVNSSSLFINVQYAPKPPSVSVSPSADIVEGRSVTLTCSSDANPAANYTWYKENQTLLQRPGGKRHFTSISSKDRGIYYCKAQNRHGHINSSPLFINVQYPPKPPSVSVSPSAEIVEGRSVNLTCSSDANPAATYTWYKENEDSPKASGQIFTITDLRTEHSGNYYCEAQNTRGRDTFTISLNVVAEAWRSAVIGTASVVFLTIILLSIVLLIRKKSSSEPSSEPGERSDNSEQLPPSPPEEQEGLHYASVRFLRNQTDNIYANIRAAGLHRHKDKEDETVEYAAVKFNSSAPRTSGEETVEDPSVLYSTVSKMR